MNSKLPTLRGYWPLLLILPAAAITEAVLESLDAPLSPQDWASNVILAVIITLAGLMVSHRQGVRQEALSETEITEKIAVLSGVTDRLRADFTASRVRQLLIDARAAMHLYPYSHPESREEFIKVLTAALGAVDREMATTLKACSEWNETDWDHFQSLLKLLQLAFSRRVEIYRKKKDYESFEAVVQLIDRLAERAYPPSRALRRFPCSLPDPWRTPNPSPTRLGSPIRFSR